MIKNAIFHSALEIKKVMTSDLPIQENPFIAFEIVDKTLPYYNRRHVNRFDKRYVAYVVNPCNGTSLEKLGTEFTTDTSFTLTSNMLKPEALYDVVVSFSIQ